MLFFLLKKKVNVKQNIQLVFKKHLTPTDYDVMVFKRSEKMRGRGAKEALVYYFLLKI